MLRSHRTSLALRNSRRRWLTSLGLVGLASLGAAQTTFDIDRTISFSSPPGLLTEGYPGPATSAIPHFVMGLQQGDDIDALSFGDDTALASTTHTIVFSVDFNTNGIAGSGVNFEWSTDTAPGTAPAAAGDIFLQGSGGNILAPTGLGYATGTGTGDEANAAWANTNCVPGNVCDDLDAFDYSTPTSANGVYFSLRAGSPTLPLLGATPGDILYSDLSSTPPIIAILAGAGLATDVNLGIAGMELDALNLIGTTGPVGSGGGVISAGSVGKNIAGIAFSTSHLIQYSVHTFTPLDPSVLVLDVPGTFIVHTDFTLLGLTPNENLNALEAVPCSAFPATYFTYNGTGTNQDVLTATPVVVGAAWTITMQPQLTRGAGVWVTLVRMNPSGGTLLDLGTLFILPPAGLSELLVGAGFIANITLAPPHAGGGSTTSYTLTIPNNCSLVGSNWYAQSIVFGDLAAGAGILDPWFSTATGGVIGTY